MPNRIQGTVVMVTEKGSLVTDLSEEQLGHVPRGETTVVRLDEHFTQGIFSADHNEPDLTLIAYFGDGGQLEIEIVGESASMMLGIRTGQAVVVEWD